MPTFLLCFGIYTALSIAKAIFCLKLMFAVDFINQFCFIVLAKLMKDDVSRWLKHSQIIKSQIIWFLSSVMSKVS